jgi:hypothetical protein
LARTASLSLSFLFCDEEFLPSLPDLSLLFDACGLMTFFFFESSVPSVCLLEEKNFSNRFLLLGKTKKEFLPPFILKTPFARRDAQIASSIIRF